MWIAARDPDSHNFAVANGCNVMVTPLMKGDEEVLDLKNKFQAALDNNPGVPRPQLMVLRHTHVHTADDPQGWEVGAKAISKFYRTFDAWFGNKTTPVNGFLAPSPEEIIPRIKYYQELGVDEFSFWCDNSLPHAEKKKSLELFIKHVVPAFR